MRETFEDKDEQAVTGSGGTKATALCDSLRNLTEKEQRPGAEYCRCAYSQRENRPFRAGLAFR